MYVDGIAEHQVAEREVSECAYLFNCSFLIYFYLTIWYINVKSCFDVLFFIIIILAELALDTILLLRQLVFCTYTLFGTLKIQ